MISNSGQYCLYHLYRGAMNRARVYPQGAETPSLESANPDGLSR